MPDYKLEQSQNGLVCGIDEAGCGPWAGPVVAAAAIINIGVFDTSLQHLINDSKKLTEKKREAIFTQITSPEFEGLDYGVGEASVAEIDTMNIGQATRLAMKRAFEKLSQKPAVALVDGIRMPTLSCEVIPVVKGDQTSLSIATASVLAKVTRDRIMRQLDQLHPEYGWLKNAGYGTKVHQEALAEHGVTPYHRRSYAPIAKLLSA